MPSCWKGGQWNVTAADWIVIPRSRSAGRKSVTVDPSSTSMKNVRTFFARINQPVQIQHVIYVIDQVCQPELEIYFFFFLFL